jgi:hypothetical protein
MRIRPFLLVLSLTLGSVMSDASLALTPVIPMVAHPGASAEEIERTYIDAYEQSGFHLVDRHEQHGGGDSWGITLVFELTGASHADNVPGTTLEITGGSMLTQCAPCNLLRLSYTAPDASNPDSAIQARGQRALDQADAAALAKVRQRLGVSLPEIHRQ